MEMKIKRNSNIAKRPLKPSNTKAVFIESQGKNSNSYKSIQRGFELQDKTNGAKLNENLQKQPRLKQDKKNITNEEQRFLDDPGISYGWIIILMALWMVINVFTGLPIIFSFSLIFFSGPYMGVLTAIFAHTLLARKYYHKSSIKDLFTVHGINIFCINLVIDIAVLTSIHYAIEEHCKHRIPSFLRYIERAIPIGGISAEFLKG